jgi:hypothetical protein
MAFQRCCCLPRGAEHKTLAAQGNPPSVVSI